MTSNRANASFDAFPFGQRQSAHCGHPYVGTLQLACMLSGVVKMGGRCRSPCPASIWADGNFDVEYGEIVHGTQVQAMCPTGSTGSLVLSCEDGAVFHEAGRCGYDCAPGIVSIGSSRVSWNQILTHGAFREFMCPNGHSGIIWGQCWNGMMNVVNGTCHSKCWTNAGTIPVTVGSVNGFADYGLLDHGEGQNASCGPAVNFTGSVGVFCDNGEVSLRTVGGTCLRHCSAGTVGEMDKAVAHRRLEHHGEAELPCNEGYEGTLHVRCEDGTVSITEGVCRMICRPGVVTSNFVSLNYTTFPHGRQQLKHCPLETHTGTLVLTCNDGLVQFTGFCGINCGSGTIPSNSAVVRYTPFPHNMTRNFSCPVTPEVYEGEVMLECFMGVVYHRGGWCGRQCYEDNMRNNGAMLTYPNLTHLETMELPCETEFEGGITYSGTVTVLCFDSRVARAPDSGRCAADCGAGKIIDNGADVFYPAMASFTTIFSTCEPRPAFGIVEIGCDAGVRSLLAGSCGTPCFAGVFSGTRTRLQEISYSEVDHNGYRSAECPDTLSGSLQFYCYDGILEVISGECGERCEPTFVTVYGASFETRLLEHLETISQPCSYNYNGNVNVTCDKGYINATSGCERLCQSGNFTLSGGASVGYVGMESGHRQNVTCPSGFSGIATLQCTDGEVWVHSGMCSAHCQAGFWSTAGGSFEISHYEINHGETLSEPCPSDDHSGPGVVLRCNDGAVELESGGCYRHCSNPPGQYFIRTGVIMPYDTHFSGETLPFFDCPSRFTGTVRTRCEDGVVQTIDGECQAHCAPGRMDDASYGWLLHREEVIIACDSAGSIVVRCTDGVVEKISGYCYRACGPGEVPDSNGMMIAWDRPLPHDGTVVGICSGYAFGSVTLRCNDTVVVPEPIASAGEGCIRHCRTGFVNTSLGFAIRSPALQHGGFADVRCPADTLGTIAVLCNDSHLSITDGECGPMNCGPGSVLSNGAGIIHEEMNNGRRGGPGACPNPYIGEATFTCANSSVTIVDISVSPNLGSGVSGGPSVQNPDDDVSDRIVLCGCCLRTEDVPAVGALSERQMGIETVIVFGFVCAMVLISTVAGCCFLRGRKKITRVAQDPADTMSDLSAKPAFSHKQMPLQIGDKQIQGNTMELEDLRKLAVAIQDKQSPGQQLALSNMTARDLLALKKEHEVLSAISAIKTKRLEQYAVQDVQPQPKPTTDLALR